MKKILAILLTLTLVFALVACGGGGDGDLVIATPDDLSTPGIRIGVQLGTTGHVHATENFPDAEVMAYDTNSDVILALLSGDVDAVIMDNLPGMEFVGQNEGQIMQLPEMLTHEGYGISLPLDSPYTALFNQALDELRANGTWQAIMDYWVYQTPDATRYVTPEGTEHPNGVLLMGTNADFPPFEFYEYGVIVGIDPCLAQAIGDILGYQIEIVDMDFAAIILAVQTGQVDFGMAGMTITEERQEMVDFTQSYFLSGQSVIVRVS
ncbi:MAG: transporter substrate-binding domain-containing protein [Oscillospiraceae bacterium]|nr:transporter substrate-binding domain-containing protein [Oscillospiraceae bacterium]